MCDIKAISLFSGMGGDSLGMETAGVRVIAYSENDRMAIKSHNANFPDSVLLGSPSNRYNLTRIPDSEFTPYRGQVNLIFAGFPCQGFSQGGKKLPSDPRNTLFREFVLAKKNFLLKNHLAFFLLLIENIFLIFPNLYLTVSCF